MGYDQSYSKTDEIALLSKITGKCVLAFLQEEMAKMGIRIVQREPISLAEDYYSSFEGEKITLSDGRIFQHKLERTVSGDDFGHSHYGWYESEETPEIKKETYQEIPELVCDHCHQVTSGENLNPISPEDGLWCNECLIKNG